MVSAITTLCIFISILIFIFFLYFIAKIGAWDYISSIIYNGIVSLGNYLKFDRIIQFIWNLVK